MTTKPSKRSKDRDGILRKRKPTDGVLPTPESKRKRRNDHADDTLSKIIDMISSLPTKHKNLVQKKLDSIWSDDYATRKRSAQPKKLQRNENKYSVISSNQQKLLLSRINNINQSTLTSYRVANKPTNNNNTHPDVVIGGIEYFDITKDISTLSPSSLDNSNGYDFSSDSPISETHHKQNVSKNGSNMRKPFPKIDISAFLSDDSDDSDGNHNGSGSDGDKSDTSSIDSVYEHVPKILAPHLYAKKISKIRSIRKKDIIMARNEPTITHYDTSENDSISEYSYTHDNDSTHENSLSKKESDDSITSDHIDTIKNSDDSAQSQYDHPENTPSVTNDKRDIDTNAATSNDDDGEMDKVFRRSELSTSDDYIEIDSESGTSCKIISPVNINDNHSSSRDSYNDTSETSTHKLMNKNGGDIEMTDKRDESSSSSSSFTSSETNSSLDTGTNDSSLATDRENNNVPKHTKVSDDSKDIHCESDSDLEMGSICVSTSSSESTIYHPPGKRDTSVNAKFVPLHELLPKQLHKTPVPTKVRLSEQDKILARTCYHYLPEVTTKLLPAQLETLEFLKKNYELAMEDIKNISKNAIDNQQDNHETSTISQILPRHARGSIVANTMGVGKTLISIAFCVWSIREYVMNRKQNESISQSLVNFPRFLIVCTKTLLDEWKAEFAKHTNNIGCYVYDNQNCRKRDLKPYSIVLTTYSRFSAEVKYVKTMGKNGKYGTSTLLEKNLFKRVILDECHIIKGRTTGFCTSIQSLECPSYRIVLSGSPFQNNMEELYPLFQFIKIPNLIPYQEFKNLSIDDRIDFITSTCDQYMVRKKLDTVSKCRVFEITVNLGPEASLVYESVLNNCIVDLKKGTLTPSEIKNNKLKTLSELRMICSNGGLLSSKYLTTQPSIDESVITNTSTTVIDPRSGRKSNNIDTNNSINIHKKQKATKFDINMIYNTPFTDKPTEKMKKSLEIILWEIEYDPTVKIIIVSNFLSTIHSVAHYLNYLSKTGVNNANGSKINLGKTVVLEGNIVREQKTVILSDFQNPNSNTRILCASSKTICVGLNIQMASVMIVYDLTPNPKDLDQTIARIDRYGQLKKVRVYKFLSSYDSALNLDAVDRSTVEHHIANRHESKNVVFDGLMDGKCDRESIKTACNNMNTKIGRTSNLEIMNKHILDFENTNAAAAAAITIQSSSNMDPNSFLNSFSSLNQRFMNGSPGGGRNNNTASAHEACVAVDQWEEWKRSIQISKSIKMRCSSKSNGCNFTTISEHEYSQVLKLHPGVVLYGLDISKYPLLYLSRLHDNILFLSLQSLTKYLHAIMLNLIFQDKDTCYKQATSTNSPSQDCGRFINFEEYLSATNRYRKAYQDIIRSQFIAKNDHFNHTPTTSTLTFSTSTNERVATNNVNQFSSAISDTIYVQPNRTASNTSTFNTNTSTFITNQQQQQQQHIKMNSKTSGNLFDSEWTFDVIVYKVTSKIKPEESDPVNHSLIDSFSGRVGWDIEKNFAFAPTTRSWKGRHTNRPINESPTRIIPRNSIIKLAKICLSPESISTISKSSLASVYNSSGLSSDNVPLRCSMIQKIIEVSLALKLSHHLQEEPQPIVKSIENEQHRKTELEKENDNDPDVMIISAKDVKKSPYEVMLEKEEQENLKLPIIHFNNLVTLTCLLETYSEHYPSVLKSEKLGNTSDVNNYSNTQNNPSNTIYRKSRTLDDDYLVENSTSETFTRSIVASDPSLYYRNPYHQKVGPKSTRLGKFYSLVSNPINMIINDSMNHHLVVIGNLQSHNTSTSLFSMMISSKQETKSLCDTSDLKKYITPSPQTTSNNTRQLPPYYWDNSHDVRTTPQNPFISRSHPKVPQFSEILTGKDNTNPLFHHTDTLNNTHDTKNPSYESFNSVFLKNTTPPTLLPPLSESLMNTTNIIPPTTTTTTTTSTTTNTTSNFTMYKPNNTTNDNQCSLNNIGNNFSTLDYSQLHQNCSYSVYDNSNKQFGIYTHPETSTELLLSPGIYCKSSFVVYSIKASQCPFLSIQLNIYYIHKFVNRAALLNAVFDNKGSFVDSPVNSTTKKAPKNDTESVISSLLIDYFKIHFIRLFTRLEEKDVSLPVGAMNDFANSHYSGTGYSGHQQSSYPINFQDRNNGPQKELSINTGQSRNESECYIYVETTEYCDILKSFLCKHISSYVETAIKSLTLHHLVGELLSPKCKGPQKFYVEIRDVRLRKSLERIVCDWDITTILPHIFSDNIQ